MPGQFREGQEPVIDYPGKRPDRQVACHLSCRVAPEAVGNREEQERSRRVGDPADFACILIFRPDAGY